MNENKNIRCQTFTDYLECKSPECTVSAIPKWPTVQSHRTFTIELFTRLKADIKLVVSGITSKETGCINYIHICTAVNNYYLTKGSGYCPSYLYGSYKDMEISRNSIIAILAITPYYLDKAVNIMSR